MNGSNHFRVLHGFNDLRTVGELIVTGTSLPIGLIMDRADGTYASLSANGNMIGFLSKKVTTPGPSFEQLELQRQHDHVKSGERVSIYQLPEGAEIQVSCADSLAYNSTQSATSPALVVTTGTGALSTTTAKDTRLSSLNGRFRVAQTGDLVIARVLESDTTDPNALSSVITWKFRIESGTVVA